MQSKEIQAAWRQLQQDQAGRDSEGIEFPSIESETMISGRNILLAMSDNDRVAVLLPLPIQESVAADQVSQIISVGPKVLVADGKNQKFIEIRCEEEGLNEVFARVVSDIFGRIETGTGSLKAVDEALEEFRRLLHKQRLGAKDEKTIVGLIGELLTLIEVVEMDPRALDAWHGPDSDRHDFRAGSVTVEVKTSLGADRKKIHINGIRQLESGDSDCLLLRHVRIEPDPDGVLAVPELVAKVGAMLGEQVQLEKKLEKLGYTADAAEAWSTKRYRFIGSNTYLVEAGFPRLTTELLAVQWPLAGVSAVSYEVDLGAASEQMIDDDTWQSRLAELCSCL